MERKCVEEGKRKRTSSYLTYVYVKEIGNLRCKWNGKHQEKKKEAGFRRQRLKGNLCAVEERLADTEREKGVMGGAMVGHERW